MKKIQRKGFTSILLFFCILSLLCTDAYSLSVNAANPEEAARSLENDIHAMNKNRDHVSRELAKTAEQLNTTVASIEATQKELDLIKAKELTHYETMKKRIKYIYENSSSMNFMTIFFQSESFADFLNRAEFVTSISSYDRDMLKEMEAIHAKAEETEAELLQQQDELNEAKSSLDATYNTLTAQIGTASAELAAYQAEIEAAKAAAEAYEKVTAEKTPSRSEEDSASDDADSSGSNSASGNSSSGNSSSGGSGSSSGKPIPPATGDTTLFAAILECEAIPSDYDALLAVATVIMNRVESPRYPNTLSGVIYQSGQFSPTWTGKLDKVLNRGPKSLCIQVAQDALNGARHDAVRNCYSFRAASTGYSGIIIGDNVFF